MNPRERRWPALDALTGKVVAYHVRKDPGKVFWWEDTEGNKTLPDGIKITDLALHNIAKFRGASEIVVVEGQKCADELRDIGIPAVGTVCGASCAGHQDVPATTPFGPWSSLAA